MRQEIIERQVHAMRQAGLDAIVSSSPENFAYVTGFPRRPRRSCAGGTRWRWSRRTRRLALLVVDMEATHDPRQERRTPTSRSGAEFTFDAMQVLADLLERRGLAAARIGHRDRLPAGSAILPSLQALLPARPLRAGAGVAGAAASDQDAGEEIEILRRLSRIADQVDHRSLRLSVSR